MHGDCNMVRVFLAAQPGCIAPLGALKPPELQQMQGWTFALWAGVTLTECGHS